LEKILAQCAEFDVHAPSMSTASGPAVASEQPDSNINQSTACSFVILVPDRSVSFHKDGTLPATHAQRDVAQQGHVMPAPGARWFRNRSPVILLSA
jgi:hypothetical protein